MRRIRLTPFFVLLFVAFGGCASPEASTDESEGAVRLTEWGATNLFQDGRMFFGGQPDEASLARLVSERGIGTVINIRYPEEMGRVDFDEPALVDSLGLRYVNIPVSPDSFSELDVARFAEVMAETDGAVLLHCASSNRVGGMWAAYLAIHEGVDPGRAITLGRKAGLRSEGMVSATRRVVGN